MNLSPSRAKYKSAIQSFQKVKPPLQNALGPYASQVFEAFEQCTTARCELVRDTAAAVAQRAIEEEILLIMVGDEEQRADLLRFLQENPESFLRTLSKKVVKAVHTAEVGKKLSSTLESL